jgi:hypothetical protein
MKINYLLILTLIFISCKSGTKQISFQKSSIQNPDEVFLNINTSSFTGQMKPVSLSEKIYLSYKFIHKYDTSLNSRLDKLLFLGEPIDYGHYSDNYDTVYKQIYDETKIKTDSLQTIIDKQPKRKKIGGKVYDSDQLSMMATKEETELIFMYPNLKDSNALKNYAKTIIERRNISKQQKTFPVFYHNPHFKSRAPSFNVTYKIQFFDSDNFEIISYHTERFTIKTFFDNTVEGKLDVNYKELTKFKKDVFDKTNKITVTVLTAEQNGL